MMLLLYERRRAPDTGKSCRQGMLVHVLPAGVSKLAGAVAARRQGE
jgi:hypothetical protein